MNNQTRIILISFAGLVVSVGLFLFVIKPTLDKVVELNLQITAKKTDLKQVQEQIVIYKNSQRDLSLAAGKDLIAQSLLKREDLQIAIEEIEKADAVTATKESLTIVDNDVKGSPVSSQIISGKGSLVEVPYNVRTISDFSHFINFLQYLEHLPHFTEVSGISLQSSSGNSNAAGVFIHDDNVIGSVDAVFFIQK